MKRRAFVLAVPALLALASATVAPMASAAPSPARNTHRHVRICSVPARSAAACHAIRNDTVTGNGRVVQNQTPAGYGPADLQAAYGLTASGGGQVVAIVDAYDDPNALSDANAYRAYFNLKTLSSSSRCTPSTTTACFSKVNQTGGTRYPRSNGGWAEEISLDLDMVSAVCPNCSILLVEATSATFTSLGTAENEAARLKANEISNSWGGGEWSGETSYDTYFKHSGIAITASSGDSGYGVQYPAASQYVTSVGGTSLYGSISGGWSETAWTGAGSGCSAYEPKPTWQSSVPNGVCASGPSSGRAVADVSAVADPYTGVAVYDSYYYQGLGGWLVFGGTSVASPLIASVYALAGNAASVNYGYPYSKDTALNFNDVTSGSNGSCGTSPLCNAGIGWDGPTGLGTPKGTGGF